MIFYLIGGVAWLALISLCLWDARRARRTLEIQGRGYHHVFPKR